MRISKPILAIDPEGRPSHYRTITAAVRQYDLESAEHLRWLILADEEYNGVSFDYDLDEEKDYV